MQSHTIKHNLCDCYIQNSVHNEYHTFWPKSIRKTFVTFLKNNLESSCKLRVTYYSFRSSLSFNNDKFESHHHSSQWPEICAGPLLSLTQWPLPKIVKRFTILAITHCKPVPTSATERHKHCHNLQHCHSVHTMTNFWTKRTLYCLQRGLQKCLVPMRP